MTPRVLSINDAGWLHAESDRTPMQVGVLAVFEKPDDADASYLSDLVQRWREVREFEPPFSYLLHGTVLPRWEVLPPDRIDLDYHFRHSALPAPGGERELGVLVSRLHSTRLDRRYPLWECHVIEGLEGNRWAMYFKVHHSQVDGVGGIRLARRIFSVDPVTRGMLPPWAIGTKGPDQSGLPDEAPAAARAAAGAVAVPDDGPGLVDAARSVAGSLGKTYAETLLGSREELRAVPWRAPKSVLNVPIRMPRRFATQTYDINRLRAVAKAVDGTLNDVFLAICGGALRRYLLDHDVLPRDSLTANVPVSVREATGASVGNAISFLYTRLGTDIEDPVERIRAIHASTRLGKERLPKANGAVMDGYTVGLMAPFLGQAMLGLGGHGHPASNLVISNVPGLREQRYLDGSRVEACYPLSLLFHGQSLNITAVSNAGVFNIGFTGCRDTVPSLQNIAVHCGEALAELEAALGLTDQTA